MIACGFASALLAALPAARADETETLESLRKQKLVAAKDWYHATILAEAAGTVRLSAIHEASVAWKEAAYELAASKQERLRALEEHRDRMINLYERVDGAKGVVDSISLDMVLLTKYWSPEAKIWTIEEAAKP